MKKSHHLTTAFKSVSTVILLCYHIWVSENAFIVRKFLLHNYEIMQTKSFLAVTLKIICVVNKKLEKWPRMKLEDYLVRVCNKKQDSKSVI